MNVHHGTLCYKLWYIYFNFLNFVGYRVVALNHRIESVCRCGMVGRIFVFQPDATARVRCSARSGILISLLMSYAFCPVLSQAVALITHSGRLALVYMPSILIHSLWLPYRHFTHEYLCCKPRGCTSYAGESK